MRISDWSSDVCSSDLERPSRSQVDTSSRSGKELEVVQIKLRHTGHRDREVTFSAGTVEVHEHTGGAIRLEDDGVVRCAEGRADSHPRSAAEEAGEELDLIAATLEPAAHMEGERKSGG